MVNSPPTLRSRPARPLGQPYGCLPPTDLNPGRPFADSFGTGLLGQSLASYWFFTRFGISAQELGLMFLHPTC
jgi:hypothetical protein